MQWQPLVLPSYRGDSRAVFVVGPAGKPDHEHRRRSRRLRRICPTGVRNPDGPAPTLVSTPVALRSSATG